MPKLITLEAVDVDGAVRDAEDNAFSTGLDRSQFLRRGAIAGGAFLASGVLFTGLVSPAEAVISTRNKSKRNDIKILNYALTLEYLESEFYIQAVRNNAFSSEAFKLFGVTTRNHEVAHVAAIKKVLGNAAIKKPKFDFGDTVTNPAKFAATAQVLEDTGVAAYAGQGPNIAQRAVVRAALSIHSVEARHAAWIRFLNGGGAPGAAAANQPAPKAFDPANREATVLRKVGATGFIKS